MCDLNRNFWRSQRAENREALIRIQRSNTQSTRHADKHTRDEALNYAGPPISHSHSLGVTLVQSRREEVATNYQGDQHTKTVWPCRSSWTVNNLINQQRLPENPTNYISANPGCIHPAKITPKVPTSFSTGSYFCPFSTISKIMERLGEIRPNKKNFIAHFTHTKHELPQCAASTLQIDFTESKKISFNSIGRNPGNNQSDPSNLRGLRALMVYGQERSETMVWRYVLELHVGLGPLGAN